ncbi:type II toxin-antitoxin system HicB family antitoxin [Runella sp. SP2]|uniref:type II toxin-antitoxin system HicB family antitoxin n=1 Tax=Runella sp. SP2 TaxID=2268026 RepID=UPI000F083F32|nr:2-oxoisovalerate dehydrogenase [Runella sp. SP2]AYQ35983.1 2-oxoisovalerate dehydrogenase [Runella sp. SP2]
MQELIFIVEEDVEGGYTARALGEAIFTQGDTVEELKEMIKDAIECHFDSHEAKPKIIRLHFVKDEVFAI